MSQCIANSKRSGRQCRSHAVRGRATCRMHGGTHPVGALAPQTIHGDYSRVLPTRLLDRYRQAQGDSELLALRNDIALIDTRLYDVLARVESGDSSQVWRELRTSYKAMQTAQRAGNTAALRLALVEIGDLIERGHGDWAAWADVRSLVRDRKSLVESERKRLVEMQQMVTATEVMTLVAALVESVRRHVSDHDALAAISTDVARLLGRPDGAAVSTDTTGD